MEGLTKILRICSRNGFLYTQISKNSLTSIQYGPLGTLLRRNIWREWLSSVVNNTDVSMFPLEVQVLRNSPNQLQQSSQKTADFLSDVFKNYLELDPVVGSGIPWGFAAYGSLGLCKNSPNSEIIFNNSLLSNCETNFSLCVAFFCSLKKSSDWFNYWAKYRYRWWRKFSSIPSKFFMSDVTETATGDQQISLMMEFPWGKEKLETITLYNDALFKKWINNLDLKWENEKSNMKPAFVLSQTELDLAVLAYISNSYTEKQQDGEIRNLFQLHTKLAPYKVSILVNEDNSEDLMDVKKLAKHVEEEFKKNKVAIFPCLGDSTKEDSSQFTRYDEMGVPYTIVLSKKALQSGIASVRNRDTALEDKVHIAELASELLKYLQMLSYGIDEF